MNILVLTPWYPEADNDPSGVFVREHARAAALRHRVAVLHLVGPVPGVAWYRLEGPDEEAIPCFRLRYRPLPGANVIPATIAVLRTFPRICKALCWRPDILHAHVYEAGFPAGVLGWRRRIPMVLTEHITTIPGGELTAGGRLKARWAMRAARRILPVSESLKEAIEKLGVTSHLCVLPNAVDTSLFRPGAPPETPRLLYVGSLIPRKDVTTLLEALAQLTAQRWELDLVGDGVERPKLEALVRRLDLRDRCRFHGRQPKTRIASLMRHSSALVLPSLSENLPCVVIEAMAAGLPVLATRVGGLPEMVSEETGILVPPADVKTLREGISQILATSFDAQRIADRAQRFSLHAVGDRLHAIYAEVTRGKADAPGGVRDGVESALRE